MQTTKDVAQERVVQHLIQMMQRAKVLIVAGTKEAAEQALEELVERYSEDFPATMKWQSGSVLITHKAGGTIAAQGLDDPMRFNGPQWSMSWIIMPPELARFEAVRRMAQSVEHIRIGTRLEPAAELVTEQEGT